MGTTSQSTQWNDVLSQQEKNVYYVFGNSGEHVFLVPLHAYFYNINNIKLYPLKLLTAMHIIYMR